MICMGHPISFIQEEIVTESPTRIRPEVVASQKTPSSGMMQYPMVRPIMHGV